MRQSPSPSPVPPLSARVVKKGSKIFSRLARGMPTPVSATSTATESNWSSSPPPSRRVRNVSVPPRGMAAKALVQRLKSTSCSVYGSPCTSGTSPSSVRTQTRLRRVGPTRESVDSTTAFRSVGCKVMPWGSAKACTRLAVRSMRSRAATIICTYSVK